ncbi:hypothetical protein [Halalkaliarchaeum desulfuricum]|uniref:hypothetical protein n=1 Tax=Halalkaliarchaeum desulfuricum TaxID=2055893 RepID=UPI00137B5D24|nr:hypothetical protein [Halalkaliarchaeum desulfuricum]
MIVDGGLSLDVEVMGEAVPIRSVLLLGDNSVAVPTIGEDSTDWIFLCNAVFNTDVAVIDGEDADVWAPTPGIEVETVASTGVEMGDEFVVEIVSVCVDVAVTDVADAAITPSVLPCAVF